MCAKFQNCSRIHLLRETFFISLLFIMPSSREETESIVDESGSDNEDEDEFEIEAILDHSEEVFKVCFRSDSTRRRVSYRLHLLGLYGLLG